MTTISVPEQYHSFIYTNHIDLANYSGNSSPKMKVFALTLLSLAALSQARVDYKLQCLRDEIGIRWPSYYSNSEYFVCQGVRGNMLTVHCNAGEVFTFVLQQCAPPSLYVPAPPIEILPVAGTILTQYVDDEPPLIGVTSEKHDHQLEHHEQSENELAHGEEPAVHDHLIDPTPPTPPTPPPTPPTMAGSKPHVPVPPPKSGSSGKKPAVPPKAAKKPSTPPKAAKRPTPPSKARQPAA